MNKHKRHTIFITGGTGCIGAVTIYKLLKDKEVGKIVVAARSNQKDLLALWLGEELDSRLEFVKLDISDFDKIPDILNKVNPTHIIHLGAYQSPDCSKHHIRGMDINTGGTMALLDAAENLPDLKRFVFASSAAVYGMRAMYPQDIISEEVVLAPPNHYGIWKLAGEHLARLFFDNTKVPTICLRLNTTYGKGREKGKTSAPTNALKAIAIGATNDEIIPFEMPYQGQENYHFVEDVGAQFAACTLQTFKGYQCFNIKGKTIEIQEFLNLAAAEAKRLGIEKYADLSVGKGVDENLFVSDLDHTKIDTTFNNLPLTEISEGIRSTLKDFMALAKEGSLIFSKESS